MNWECAREYYMRAEVKKEIAEYCVGRWVAIHCEERDDGVRPMIRYWSRGRPLTIRCEEDIGRILERFSSIRPRAFLCNSAYLWEACLGRGPGEPGEHHRIIADLGYRLAGW